MPESLIEWKFEYMNKLKSCIYWIKSSTNDIFYPLKNILKNAK